MRRKLIKQGADSATLTMPRKWLRKHNISPGDEIVLEEMEHSLLVRPPNSISKKKTQEFLFPKDVHITYMRSVIASFYKAGYHELVLHFQKIPSLAKIHSLIGSFSGLEIVSMTDNTLRLRCFITEDPTEVESIIIKMFQNIQIILQETAAGKVESGPVTSVVNQQIRKMRDLALRIIHMTSYGGEHSYDYYDLVTQLEKVATELKYIAAHVEQHTVQDNSLLVELSESFTKMYNVYLKKDHQTSFLFWNTYRKSAAVREKRISEEKDTKSGSFYHSLHRSFTHILSRIVAISHKAR